MKKQGSKKPPVRKAESKPAVKKKRLRRLSPAEKLRALLIAATLVLVAAIFSLAVIHVNSVRFTGETAVQPFPSEEEVPAAPLAPTPIPVPGEIPAAFVPLPPAREIPPPAPETEPEARGSLVFVIDDAGHNLRDLEPFLAFPGPITIAVLPGLPHSAEAARRVRAAGKELILHQPMESIRGTDPGPYAIWAGMNGDEIRSIINRNLDEIWPVAGMNNHEGSRITMDEEAMETILSLSRERGILFLDSRTTAETAAPRVAQRLGITIGERDIFLDNYQERESILYFINRGLLRAQQNGLAIMIGHVWSPELAPLLKEMYADLIEQGYTFSSLTEAITQKQ